MKIIELPLSKQLLTPLSWPLSLVTSIRRLGHNYHLFPKKEFAVPIISVGNLTFGGTGKTPFTLWMARHLEAMGLKSLILIRGYKGSMEDYHTIIHCDHRFHYSASEVGDEAILLAQGLQHSAVVVGKRRSENLERYFHQVQPDVVILDDGHQHLQLGRNLNIVLFDAMMPISSYQVAPCGYLREGLSALYDADIVILGRSKQVSSSKIEKLQRMVKHYMRSDTVIAMMDYQPTRLLNHSGQEIMGPQQLAGYPVICLAGIASPDSFFHLIESLGANIIDRHSFLDHHPFSASELEPIIEQARSHNAIVVTTEKDFMRIKQVLSSELILYLEIAVEFHHNGQQMLQQIEECIKPVYPLESK
ncbi:MAG: tetraacyldisaccharide 4'-kinase [Bdellovibrionales bacterium]|jgi:tetraacyldisaccharide 4'-kinase|nr:tetraacyldisaccharide 4'-kinase [Bdellovibrionales bacterium]MBT3526917.1 tetraacyldisaccharide 4'-kinase [Bdellovibrionales bacterium]MBT7669635.1 tetraacyldisaccharide 4'-kinase [Bdellovibrionales bacterium]MBT7767020.1 tetraacyldisaccharide 4'-kinase [Bdellovibrionales bacterium]